MRLSWSLFLGVTLLLLPWAHGCSADELAAGPTNDKGVAGVDAQVEFEHDGTLTLAPGEEVVVTAVGKPSARYAMTFLLVGDSLDGSLDRTAVVADDDGRASVTLRAPNAATYFAVHVTIKEGPTATLNVAVSEEGFGTLSVNPEYSGGRDTREWVASVVAGTTCEALAETFPDDPVGPTPVTGPADEPILIADVPVGPNLAVFVRAGHYMWGCADENGLVANDTVEVAVVIKNAPLDLGSAELDVSLDFAPDAGEWGALVAVQRAAFIDAFLGGVAAEEMLVSAMADVYAGDAQEFATASASWPTEVATHFGTHGVDFTTTIAALIDEGLGDETPEITGSIAGVEPNHALLTLHSFGTATAEDLNVPDQYVMSFSADPNDKVRLGGTLFWMPSRYLGHVAEQKGHLTYTGHAEFGEVLGEVAQCESLVLTGLSSCTGQCIVDLCVAALGDRWETALASSAETLLIGELPFESSGQSTFDDRAVVTGFDGTWLGELVAGDDRAVVSGAAVATEAGSKPD